MALLSIANCFAGDANVKLYSIIGSACCALALVFGVMHFVALNKTPSPQTTQTQTINPEYQGTFVNPTVTNTSLTGTLSFKNPLNQTKTYHIELAIRDTKTSQVTAADLTVNVNPNTVYTNTIVVILPTAFNNHPVQVKLVKVEPLE